MKVPTRRWGNAAAFERGDMRCRLNESPHPKVGKFIAPFRVVFTAGASMKVPTRRWGN